MDDESIVQLYWDRDEAALSESAGKYGAYCTAIARNILRTPEDAEECVNDTWLRAWNAMPPHRPDILSAFFGKITRNLCFDRYRQQRRVKRGSGSLEEALDELGECVSGYDEVQEQLELRQLGADIDRFLMAQPKEKRYMFILRYWYAYGISDIAARMDTTVDNVSVSLSRLRKKMKDYLTERSYVL